MPYPRAPRLLLAAAAVFVLTLGLAAMGQAMRAAPSAEGSLMDRLVAIEGVVELDGREAIVEVLVLVRPGEDPERRARRALHEVQPEAVELREEGEASGDIASQRYTTTGLVWDTLPVTVHYNGAGAPVSGGLPRLQAALQTWTNVSTSSFAFDYGGTTTRCPSLFVDCPGPQTFDGNNDVGWADIAGSGVLGVTWYSTSIDEFDIIIDNADYAWHTGGLPVPFGKFDYETVALHELGHGLGLGHTSVSSAAVMWPSVAPGQAKRTPHADDVNGISFLYPGSSPTPTNTPVPPTATNTPVPPTPTNTPVPPTATNTPLPPTPTNTPPPPQATNTPVPPTATNTPLPPTATNTPLPPQPTNTPVPPTATSTATGTPPQDTTPPTVSIISPADDATVSGSVKFAADAADAEGLHKVRFWVEGVYLGYDLTAPYSKTWDTTGFANGRYTLTVQALDWAGNATFDTIKVTVLHEDETPPTVSIISPADDATVSGSVTFAANASDAEGLQKVRFWAEGTYLGYDMTAPYSKTWDTTALPNGRYTLTVQALDWGGNSTFDTIKVTVLHGDETPPTVSITSPADDATVTGAVSFAADASDAEGLQKVRFWAEGTYLGYDLTAPYSKTWDTTALPNGRYTLTVQALDWGGNSTFDTIKVTVLHGDETPPTVSITSPTDGATVSGAVTFAADASDAEGLQKVRFWADGTYLGYDMTAPYSKTWDTTAFANGSHVLTVQALDWAGHSTFDSITVTVLNWPNQSVDVSLGAADLAGSPESYRQAVLGVLAHWFDGLR